MPTIPFFWSFIILLPVTYGVASVIWNVYFSSLSKIPGPKIAAATRLILIWHKAQGDAEHWRLHLHCKYGDAVRVAPSEVSFANGAAWKQIYGHAPGSKLARHQKDPTFYAKHFPEVNLVDATDEDHVRHRKCFSHAFSDKALSDQEPLVQQYVSQLVSNIGQAKDSIDLVRQYNFTTFDIMADLAFGESLECLAKSDYNSWISLIFASLRIGTMVSEINRHPSIRALLEAMIPRSLKEKKEQHLRFAIDRVDRRLSKEVSRSDIWQFVLASEDKGNVLTRGEMHANAGAFMIAGTDTTATLLSALTYYLLVNPNKMRLLTQEIRGRFPSAEQIRAKDLMHLKYLNACVYEGLRIHPAVPIGLPRVVSKGGAEICEHKLPEGTTIYVHQLSTYHSTKNFTRPNEFLPQRWLLDDPDYKHYNKDSTLSDLSEFAADDRSCLQPFSIGPRSCIGVNLAWLEIRLIIAHVIWQFDLELTPDQKVGVWNEQQIFSFWDKKPLMVRATPVVRPAR